MAQTKSKKNNPNNTRRERQQALEKQLLPLKWTKSLIEFPVRSLQLLPPFCYNGQRERNSS